uniref:Uncharacterized protein n=1 Tax=Calcidiscus leptoporus TaxID=127549 RepID=A0A7S0J8I3_9EUKA
MGSSGSKKDSGEAAASPVGTFTVRMSPAFASAASGHPIAAAGTVVQDPAPAPPQPDVQQTLPQMTEAEQRQAQLSAVQAEGVRREHALAAAIDALHKREYMAPAQPMACKEEREAALECYKRFQSASSGDVVFACENAVRELDKCANLVRLAAVAKIVPGSLP